jgi:hypothetical protein
MKLPDIIRRLGAPAVASVLFVFVACQAGAQTATQAPPGWIADSHTGCKVWNALPQPDESVTWSGPCKGGLANGQGTLQWFEHGRPDVRYDGEYQDGKRNGHGVVTDTHGNRVEGDFRNDEPVTMAPNEIDFIAR